MCVELPLARQQARSLFHYLTINYAYLLSGAISLVGLPYIPQSLIMSKYTYSTKALQKLTVYRIYSLKLLSALLSVSLFLM